MIKMTTTNIDLWSFSWKLYFYLKCMNDSYMNDRRVIERLLKVWSGSRTYGLLHHTYFNPISSYYLFLYYIVNCIFSLCLNRQENKYRIDYIILKQNHLNKFIYLKTLYYNKWNISFVPANVTIITNALIQFLRPELLMISSLSIKYPSFLNLVDLK